MDALSTGPFDLRLPPHRAGRALDQNEEWFEVEIDGDLRRVRLHDYAALYDLPGLYEQVYSELLQCRSPDVVSDMLGLALDNAGLVPADLAALDFGAGNGMVGELLARMGFGKVVGVDLLPQARAAALRDRPGTYDDYRVVDLTAMCTTERAVLMGHRLDCLTCVAALGFGYVPRIAFAEAFNIIVTPGWLALNLPDRSSQEEDPTSLGALIRRMLDEGVIEQRGRRRYTHRVSIAGKPLHYVALVARKRGDVPLDWLR